MADYECFVAQHKEQPPRFLVGGAMGVYLFLLFRFVVLIVWFALRLAVGLVRLIGSLLMGFGILCGSPWAGLLFTTRHPKRRAHR
jgi:hypothetical protein